MSEILYQAELSFTTITDFGLALPDMLSGEKPVPPQGARFDVGFEGPLTGRLAGKLTGVDYLRVRADGRMELDLHGVVERADGTKIAWSGTGVGTPRQNSPLVDILEVIQLDSADPDLGWLLTRRLWGEGVVDPTTGSIKVTVYM